MPRKVRQPTRPDVREDCLREALAIIAETGVEKLSLREVARRLGLSHGAPYKHYFSRDHLLAEVIGRAFDDFSAHLDVAVDSQANPGDALEAMGRAYLGYAAQRPLEYRLMFNTPLPDPQAHPAMVAKATHAFDLLRGTLTRAHSQADRQDAAKLAAQDALHVWATMHGLATLLRHEAIGVLGISDEAIAGAPDHTLARLGAALERPSSKQR